MNKQIRKQVNPSQRIKPKQLKLSITKVLTSRIFSWTLGNVCQQTPPFWPNHWSSPWIHEHQYIRSKNGAKTIAQRLGKLGTTEQSVDHKNSLLCWLPDNLHNELDTLVRVILGSVFCHSFNPLFSFDFQKPTIQKNEKMVHERGEKTYTSLYLKSRGVHQFSSGNILKLNKIKNQQLPKPLPMRRTQNIIPRDGVKRQKGPQK